MCEGYACLENGERVAKFRILLLTNRDSDNVGDQIIEATVISILKGVMKNLEISEDAYEISSRAAGIISKKYMKTNDQTLLEGARKAISAADVIVFGGAPLFNYSYQNFYLRTIKTLELAEEYGVPVLFSSIGVEPFNADNPKSARLKKALELSCVRQITTRDDIASLEKYVEGTNTPVAHVSDPAVFADIVFRKKPAPMPTPAPQPTGIKRLRKFAGKAKRGILRRIRPQKSSPAAAAPAQATQPAQAVTEVPKPKRIGLVVTRAGIFKDNRIDFSENDQRQFWLDVIADLEDRGYEYKLFTTGHFSDEVFLDAFIKEHGISVKNAAVTVNSPEELIHELAACDGVIAYRLHASITSYAYAIPSVGLSWNFKVPYFYDSVGHGDRAFEPEHWNATTIVSALEKAMAEGVDKDEQFLMSVYETLFTGLKAVASPDSERESYSMSELGSKLPRFGGTSTSQYREKVRRKLRRTYENYQKLSEFRLAHQTKKG